MFHHFVIWITCVSLFHNFLNIFHENIQHIYNVTESYFIFWFGTFQFSNNSFGKISLVFTNSPHIHNIIRDYKWMEAEADRDTYRFILSRNGNLLFLTTNKRPIFEISNLMCATHINSFERAKIAYYAVGLCNVIFVCAVVINVDTLLYPLFSNCKVAQYIKQSHTMAFSFHCERISSFFSVAFRWIDVHLCTLPENSIFP